MTVPTLAQILVFDLLNGIKDTNKAAEFLHKYLLRYNGINVSTIAAELHLMMGYEGSHELLSMFVKL